MEAKNLADCIQQVHEQGINSLNEELDKDELPIRGQTSRESITYFEDYTIIYSVVIQRPGKEEVEFLKKVSTYDRDEKEIENN